MTKTMIASDAAPPPTDVYSPALRVGDWVFLTGQGGFDPQTIELVSTEIEAQTEQTLRNVEALLAAAGCSLRDVVSCLVHLSDLSLFSRYDAVFARFFEEEPRPVRTTVGADLAVPGMLVEVTVVAHAQQRDEAGETAVQDPPILV